MWFFFFFFLAPGFRSIMCLRSLSVCEILCLFGDMWSSAREARSMRVISYSTLEGTAGSIFFFYADTPQTQDLTLATVVHVWRKMIQSATVLTQSRLWLCCLLWSSACSCLLHSGIGWIWSIVIFNVGWITRMRDLFMASDASKEAAGLVFLKDNQSGPSVNPLLSAQASVFLVFILFS